MTRVLTCLGPALEGQVAALVEAAPGLDLARRCADLAELLSCAAAGLGQVALVSADVRGLDLSGIARLRDEGLCVVGIHMPRDEDAQRRLHQWGLHGVVSGDVTAAGLGEALSALDQAPTALADPVLDGAAPAGGPLPAGLPEAVLPQPGTGDRGPALDAWPSPALVDSELARMSGDLAAPEEPGHAPESPEGSPTGRIVVVWGPAGAPGRTTLAVNLAAQAARRGIPVLLVDADTYAASVAQSLSVLDEAPGVAAATRAAEAGSLDLTQLARLAPEAAPGLRVLTGLPRADRWLEVRAEALTRVLEVSRSLVRLIVVDVAFCLEEDEELSYDTTAPRRNEATLASLAAADEVLAVGAADPIGLQRLVRGVQELESLRAPAPRIVVNRLRASSVGRDPQARVRESLERFAGLGVAHTLPDEPDTMDVALLRGRAAVELAPDGPYGRSVAAIVDDLVPETAGAVQRDLRRPRLLRRGRV